MNGYDAWLERPYQQREAEAAALEAFAEREGLDPDDPELEAKAEAAWADEMEAQLEAAAEAMAEDRYW